MNRAQSGCSKIGTVLYRVSQRKKCRPQKCPELTSRSNRFSRRRLITVGINIKIINSALRRNSSTMSFICVIIYVINNYGIIHLYTYL